MAPSPFLEQVRAEIRLRGYSIRTEKSYLSWIKRYICFHHKRHPSAMGALEVKAFLSWLATEQNVAINTQKVALNALAFLYNRVLKVELGDLGFTLATKQRHLPIVLSATEVAAILTQMAGRDRLIFSLLYGSGLRVNECLRLRVQDVCFSRMAVTVRDGKGRKDRQTLLSTAVVNDLQAAINIARQIQRADNKEGIGPSLPTALAKKYPNAFRSPAWMYIFPSSALSRRPSTDILCRHHLHDSVVRKALKIAVVKAGIDSTRQLPHLSPFICNTPSRTGL